MKRRMTLVLLSLVYLIGCGGSPTPTPDVVATQVSQAQAVAATLTAAAAPTATLTPTVADTPSPTATPTVTNTPVPTLSPTQRPTSTPRPTRQPTYTSRPTSTPTPIPGIGQLVRCGDLYEIGALEELELGVQVSNAQPKGVFAAVRFQVTNLQSRTESFNMFDDEVFSLMGQLDGRWVQFTVSGGARYGDKMEGWSDWWEDLPPGIPVKAIAHFDVNPDATDWALVFSPQIDFRPACEVLINVASNASGGGAQTPEPVASPTKKPASTPKPTIKPPTPTPAMQLLADSQADFTGSQGQNSWEYLFSEGRDTFNWKQMSFDGACWRGPFENEQVRICPDHGAPGAKGDIAWLYKAETSDKLVFKVTAKKAEAQGDDIRIRIYRHTNLLDTWYLDEGDMQGFTRQFELDVNGGEMFFFTMQVRSTWREFKYDPSVFHIQVYLKE